MACDPNTLLDQAKCLTCIPDGMQLPVLINLMCQIRDSVAADITVQNANTIFAGPTAGAAALPTFRAMVNADLGTGLTPQLTRLGIGAAADPANPLTIGAVLSVASNGTITTTINGITAILGTNCHQFINNTAAQAGIQEYSPSIRMTGQGWKTNAVAGSQTVDLLMTCVPVQGAAAPSGLLTFHWSINGGAYAFKGSISDGGTITGTGFGTIASGGGFTGTFAPGAGTLTFDGGILISHT